MKKFLLFVWELVKVAAISAVIIIPVRYYLIQPFYVKGASMEPNFHDSEYLIIDEISYRINEPERGQVIVFRYPKNPQEYYIKRIIGLPNEEVQIKEGEVIIYNEENPQGLILSETYLEDDLETFYSDTQKIKIGESEYFVLGDNRNASKDSRSFGTFDENFIIGKVLLRGWPLDKITLFNKEIWPIYQ